MLLRPCRPGLVGRPRGLVSAWAPPVAGSPPPDPVSVALALVVAGFSSAPSSPRQTAMYNLISALMSAGIWAKLDRLYVLRAGEDQGSRVNWKNPGTGNAAKTGTGGTFTADVGWSAPDASNYVSTGFNPSTDAVNFLRNDNSFFAATTTDSNDAVSAVLCGNTQFTLQPRSSGAAIATRNASTGQDTGSGNTGAGLYGTTRNVSTAYNRWKGASLVDSPTRSSTAHASAVIYVGTHNLSNFSTKTCGLVLIGGYVDATAVAALNTAWSAYVAAL